MCFSLIWWQNLFIWIIIVGAVIAILKLLIPWVFSFLGVNTGPLLPALNIVLYAIIAIFVVYLIFALLSCLMGGGFSLPSLHRG